MMKKNKNLVILTLSLIIFNFSNPTSFAKGYSSCGKTGKGFSLTNIAVNDALISSIYARHPDGSSPVCYHSGIGGSSVDIHAYENKTAAKYTIWDNGESTVTLVLNQSNGVHYCEYKLGENNALTPLPESNNDLCTHFSYKLFKSDPARYGSMVKVLKGLQDTWQIAYDSYNPQTNSLPPKATNQPLRDRTIIPNTFAVFEEKQVEPRLKAQIKLFLDLI